MTREKKARRRAITLGVQPTWLAVSFNVANARIFEGKSGVYAIVNPKSDTAYVGSSVNIGRRLHNHYKDLERGCHHCVFLQRAWVKDGAARFLALLLEEVGARELLADREQIWLNLVPLQYNVNPLADRPPSQAGRIVSAEERLRASIRFKTIPRTAEWRQRIGDAHRGKTLSIGQIEGIRQRLRRAFETGTGIYSQESLAKKAAALRGRCRPPFSAETRKRISLAGIGRHPTEATKEKMRTALRGRRLAESTKEKISTTLHGHTTTETTRGKIRVSVRAWWDRKRHGEKL